MALKPFDEKLFRAIWTQALDDAWGKPEFLNLNIPVSVIKMVEIAALDAMEKVASLVQIS